MVCRALVGILLLLASCGPSARLYTDDLFRAAAPEVVAAWRTLPPWHQAGLVSLPTGAGWSSIRSDLETLSPTTAALIGVALSADDRQNLARALPKRRLVFFAEEPGHAWLAVDRAAGWEALAKAVAPLHRPAVALVDANAPDDRTHLTRAWTAAGGLPLTVWVWPEMGAIAPGTDVLQAAGPQADAKVATLADSTALYGPPETVLPTGARGLTWRVRESGLADFLWIVATGNDTGVHFLPLETVPWYR